MKVKIHNLKIPTLAALLLGAIQAAAAWDTLYYEDFSGAAGASLNGLAPTIRPGSETWTLNNNTAFDSWKANGSVLAGGGSPDGRSSMQLPFTPLAGNKYQFSVTLSSVTATDNNQWIGTGFSTALNNADGASGLWAFGAGINGVSWLILRNPATGGQFDAFAGPQTSGVIGGSYAGSNPLGVRMVLDATAAQWTTSVFVTAANINGGVETQLGSTYVYAANPTINGVGFTKAETIGAMVDNFKLEVEVIPEPATLTLGLLGGLCLIALRRRVC